MRRGLPHQLQEVTSRRGPGTVRSFPARAALGFLTLALLASAGVAHAQTVDERFTVCLACHGADGQSRIPETPSLGGQPSFFVVAQLFLFREGRRDNPAMIAAAKGLTNDDLMAFAERVTKLPPPPPPEDRARSRPLRARADTDSPAPVRGLPQPGFLRPRADAAPGQSAGGVPAQGHAGVQERRPARLRRRHVAGPGRAHRPGPDRPRPLSRPRGRKAPEEIGDLDAPIGSSQRRYGGAPGSRTEIELYRQPNGEVASGSGSAIDLESTLGQVHDPVVDELGPGIEAALVGAIEGQAGLADLDHE